MKHCIVILNKKSGSGAQEVPDMHQKLRKPLAAEGLKGSIYWEDPQNIHERLLEARERKDISLILVGGGDGTLNTAANVLAGTGSIYVPRDAAPSVVTP